MIDMLSIAVSITAQLSYLSHLPRNFKKKNLGKTLSLVDKGLDLPNAAAIIAKTLLPFEKLMIAYERCQTYQELPSEPGYQTVVEDADRFECPDKDPKKIMELMRNPRRSTAFRKGILEFRNVSAKYATSRSYVLRNLSFTIK